ncbi:MAG: hypothetical protein KGH79_00485 [Patescibacteria group bacterium]|nr:hypothetical protein [Patescibacteria group bacterium]
MPSFLARLWRCLFVWRAPAPRGDLSDAQAIFTQAASNLVGGASSQTNIALARFAQDLHKRLGLPVYAQGEVAEVLKQNGVPLVGETPKQGTAWIGGETYISTMTVARAQQAKALSMGWKTIIPVTFLPHIGRTVWVYERMGLRVIIPPDLPKNLYEKKMELRYWRYRVTGYAYELAARLAYLYKGYI